MCMHSWVRLSREKNVPSLDVDEGVASQSASKEDVYPGGDRKARVGSGYIRTDW